LKTFNTVYTSIDDLKQYCNTNNISNNDEILLQIFTGITNNEFITELVTSIVALFPNIKIIGSTTDGEILGTEIKTDSTILSFSIFEKSKVEVYATCCEQNSYNTAQNLVQQIPNLEQAKAAILFTDGLNTNGELFIKAFHDYAPDIIVAGGLAGDNSKFHNTIVFTHKGIEDTSAVSAVLFGEELIVNTSYNFGWKEIGHELTITHAESNRVYSINGMSAVSIYNKYLGENIGRLLPETGIEFPLIVQRDGYKIARAVIKKNDDGSLVFAGDLRTGEKVHFGYGNIDDILESRYPLYNKLLEKPIESIFVYSSMARKNLLRDAVKHESAPLAKIASVSGFFTYGEFYFCDKDDSYCQNHMFNQTMTILTLSESDNIHDIKLQSSNRPKKSILTVQALTNLINVTTDELKESKNKMKEYIKLVDQNIITSSTDLKGYITHVSDAFCQISGYSKEELIGKNHNIIRHPDMPNSTFKQMWALLTHNKPWSGEIKNLKSDGSYYWVKATIYPNFDHNGNKVGYTGIRQDITNKKHIQELSITDGLTNIYNRRHFNDIFPKVINSSKRYDDLVAFIILDIDCFKQYNDTYGHQMGDEALIKVASAIKNTLKRADDYCFRLGGEEFAIVFKVDHNEQALTFANTIKENIQNLNIEHKTNLTGEYITASIGLVCKKAGEIIDDDSIYKETDDLLYEAKKQGRNQVVANITAT